MIVSGWHVQICSDIVFLLSGNVQLPIHQIQGHNAFGVLHRMSNLGMKLPQARFGGKSWQLFLQKS